MNEAPKVGDTIYEFDANRRVYAPDQRGGPIFREHFRPFVIVGEEGRSWLLSHDPKSAFTRTVKVGKQSIGKGRYYTASQMEDEIWVRDHRHRIDRLMMSASADQLRQIAAILGYTPEDLR